MVRLQRVLTLVTGRSFRSCLGPHLVDRGYSYMFPGGRLPFILKYPGQVRVEYGLQQGPGSLPRYLGT